MICVSPIMNLRNSNLSTNKTNNNYKQNNLNAFKTDSVSFGNAIPKPQQLADAFETLVGQVRRGPETVDKAVLGGFVRDMAAFTKQSVQAAELNFTLGFPRPVTIVLDDLTEVTRKFEPCLGDRDNVPALTYTLKAQLVADKYPKGSYLLVTDYVDDPNIAKAMAYNAEVPQSIFAKIMQKNVSVRRQNIPWTVTDAGISIPSELDRADFHLYHGNPTRIDTITLA